MKHRAHKHRLLQDPPPEIGFLTDRPWIKEFFSESMCDFGNIPSENLVRFKEQFVRVLISVLDKGMAKPTVFSFEIDYKTIGPISKRPHLQKMLSQVLIWEHDLDLWNSMNASKIQMFDPQRQIALCGTIANFAKSHRKSYWTILPRREELLFGTRIN